MSTKENPHPVGVSSDWMISAEVSSWFSMNSRIFQPSISWHLHRDPVVFAHSSLFISHHSLGAKVNHFCVSLAQPPLIFCSKKFRILILCACSILTSKERGMNIKLHQHQKTAWMFISNCLLRPMCDNLKKHISLLNWSNTSREKENCSLMHHLRIPLCSGDKGYKIEGCLLLRLMF